MADDLDEDLLERLRRGVPIRMDSRGAFFFDGAPVTHERVNEALRRGLDASDTGEPIVRLGPQWCYLHVDDLPLRALGVAEDPEGFKLRLDDGRLVPLLAETLWEEPERGLRCLAPSAGSGRMLEVRFTNKAQMDLAPRLRVSTDGRVHVRLGDKERRIPTRPPSRTDVPPPD